MPCKTCCSLLQEIRTPPHCGQGRHNKDRYALLDTVYNGCPICSHLVNVTGAHPLAERPNWWSNFHLVYMYGMLGDDSYKARYVQLTMLSEGVSWPFSANHLHLNLVPVLSDQGDILELFPMLRG